MELGNAPCEIDVGEIYGAHCRDLSPSVIFSAVWEYTCVVDVPSENWLWEESNEMLKPYVITNNLIILPCPVLCPCFCIFGCRQSAIFPVCTHCGQARSIHWHPFLIHAVHGLSILINRKQYLWGNILTYPHCIESCHVCETAKEKCKVSTVHDTTGKLNITCNSHKPGRWTSVYRNEC